MATLFVNAWMPPSLLPPKMSQRPASAAQPKEKKYLTWRLHVREISIDGLPSRRSAKRDWDGLHLRFVAEWSRESKRTTATQATGNHTWWGEHATLALPPHSGSGGVPETDAVKATRQDAKVWPSAGTDADSIQRVSEVYGLSQVHGKAAAAVGMTTQTQPQSSFYERYLEQKRRDGVL